MWAVVQRERDAQEALAKRKRDACESVKVSVRVPQTDTEADTKRERERERERERLRHTQRGKLANISVCARTRANCWYGLNVMSSGSTQPSRSCVDIYFEGQRAKPLRD